LAIILSGHFLLHVTKGILYLLDKTEQSLLLSFWTLSIVRISTNRKHNVSETGSVSVFRRGEGTYSTEKPKACLSTGDARTKEGQPLASPVERQAFGFSVEYVPPPRLKTETDPLSETLCFLFVEIRTMDKVQKLSSNECYIPSSEPFRMYFSVYLN
jgi:hypothetical protein